LIAAAAIENDEIENEPTEEEEIISASAVPISNGND
jgi:hypothetical protein